MDDDFIIERMKAALAEMDKLSSAEFFALMREAAASSMRKAASCCAFPNRRESMALPKNRDRP